MGRKKTYIRNLIPTAIFNALIGTGIGYLVDETQGAVIGSVLGFSYTHFSTNILPRIYDRLGLL